MTDKKPSAVQIATDRQITASNPMHSAWVSASAGSGKTKVLVQRILRLLLNNTNPQQILGITYTKAAAAEMQNRISKELQEWAICNEADLNDSLKDALGDTPTPEHTTAARSLFAQVLDTPGGIKIQTIHSFCQSLLAQFPLESGVSVGFRVLENTDSYYKNALHTLSKDPHCIPHLQQVMKYGDKDKFYGKLNTIFSKREVFKNLLKMGDTNPYDILDIRATDTPQTYESKLVTKFKEQFAVLQDFQNIIDSEKDKKTVAKFYTAIETVTTAPLSFNSVQSFFDTVCKADSTEFSLGRGKQPLILKENIHILDPVAEIYATYKRNIIALNMAKNAESVMVLADKFIGEYTYQKQRDNVLDFDDIIYKTKALFKRVGIAEWVTYKTDRGHEHILLDESQDTSPDQWEILRAIIQPFFEHENQQVDAYPEKTVFAVGDYKQSIYSFQGADPQGFSDNRKTFKNLATQNKYDFKDIPLDVSFRTVPAVLQWVDETMLECNPEYTIEHDPHRANDYGRVELMPVLYTQNKIRTPAPIVYANEIAHKITNILNSSTYLPSKKRHANAGDILVLVQTRNKRFVNSLIRALHNRGVAVAGNDRLKLYDDIAVQDMLALLQFIILPNDDLTLACVLKSPLIGLTDAQIFEFAHNRETKTLLGALGDYGEKYDKKYNDSKYADIYKYIDKFLKMADFKRPFEILNTILNSPCCLSLGGDTYATGRQAFVARLGTQVNDVLDETLQQAMSFETDNIPTIQAFLDMVKNDNETIKRDADSTQNNEVRIMTVHGAKGLESPIVILPDAYRKPSPISDFVFNTDNTKMLIAHNKNEHKIAQNALGVGEVEKQKQTAESERLLYVAMTRAEDMLICGGYGQSHSEWCWYNALHTSIKNMGGEQSAYVPYDYKDIWGDDAQAKKDYGTYTYVYTHNRQNISAPPIKGTATTENTAHMVGMPEWATKLADRESETTRPLNPHSPHDIDGHENPPAPSPLLITGDGHTPTVNDLYKRGNIIHNALEHITVVNDNERERALYRYLQTPSFDLPAETQQQYAHEILSVIKTHPQLFGENTRAEVPVSGIITIDGTEKPVSGIIDRLCVTDDTVWIVDFKSNRPPTTDIDKVPPAYKKQVKMYGDLVEKIYPNHKIRTALLWTFNCQLLEIPR